MAASDSFFLQLMVYKYQCCIHFSIIQPESVTDTDSQRNQLPPIIMQKSVFLILLVAVMFTGEVISQEGLLAAPKIPGELSDYLKALSDYYAIAARPRFGRSLKQRSAYRTLADDA